MPHSAADFFSPLFGSVMSFKADQYNTLDLGGKTSVPKFGEKPFLYYTSYLLNQRFGERSRHAQAHFSHSISRRVMKEAMSAFPGPAAKAACDRFRGESTYQMYPWYTAFHYSIERFREALLWSFIVSRSDINGDGYLSWPERQQILKVLEPGMNMIAKVEASGAPVGASPSRDRMYYKLPELLQDAGLTPPKVNLDVLWTSLDGPETIRKVKCADFSVDKCLAESFASPISDNKILNPEFHTSNIFSRLSSQYTKCGDCLLKMILASSPRGLEPLLPDKSKAKSEREVIIKALTKYQHTIVEPNAKFVMVRDAEQANQDLLERGIMAGKQVGQYCLNDDVMTEDPAEVDAVRRVMTTVFETLFPEKGAYEI